MLKTKFVLLFSGLSFLSLHCLDTASIATDNKKHLPCYVGLDQTHIEKFTTDIGAPITWNLGRVIVHGIGLVIASASLVKNLANENPIITEDHEIFDVPGTQFLAVIPKKINDLYSDRVSPNDIKANLNMDQLKRLPFTSWQDAPQLIAWINQHKKSFTRFSAQDFTKIFKTKNTQSFDPRIVWDFIINGHGETSPPSIADLTPAEINSMLDFFDTKINVGTVYIQSCSAGGKNLTLLELTDEGIQVNHNFILIVGAISDSEIISPKFEIGRIFLKYFLTAAQLRDRGKSLNELLLSVSATGKVSGITRPILAARIPQIWLPGGIGFQTFNIEKEVFVLGKAVLAKYTEDEKPIVIKGPEAVLVYPQIIPVPIKIIATQLNVDRNWPEFISMNRELGTHYFTKIITQPIITQPLVGPEPQNGLGAFMARLPENIRRNIKKYTDVYESIRASVNASTDPMDALRRIAENLDFLRASNSQIYHEVLQEVTRKYPHLTAIDTNNNLIVAVVSPVYNTISIYRFKSAVPDRKTFEKDESFGNDQGSRGRYWFDLDLDYHLLLERLISMSVGEDNAIIIIFKDKDNLFYELKIAPTKQIFLVNKGFALQPTGPSQLSMGVMEFIQQAFLTMHGGFTMKQFLIDKLIGKNDIEPLIGKYGNGPIELNNVRIYTRGSPDIFSLSFQVDGLSWQYNEKQAAQDKPTNKWNLLEGDPNHQDEYEKIKRALLVHQIPEQLSISNTLKKKYQEIQAAKRAADAARERLK